MADGRARNNLIFGLAAAAILVAAAIWFWYSRTVVEQTAALVLSPVTFEQLPGWQSSDSRPALSAFRKSCLAFAADPPASSFGGVGYAGAAVDWQIACAAVPRAVVDSTMARHYFEAWFAPFSVGSHGSLDGLFTGYYEPEIRVSRLRHGRFETPIYGRPPDLVGVDLGLFRSGLKGEHIAGRLSDHAVIPYVTRAEIDSFGLKSAPVLLYAENPIAVFFLQIQGSGRGQLENGETIRLAYAGENGRRYTSIGRVLIEKGMIAPNRVSMPAIKQWLVSHPAQARATMESDESYVFFREAAIGDPALGSPGSEGVPLTPGATIAIDERFHPLGAPFYIATRVPDPDPVHPDKPFDALFVAQDTGGAIRGAARADIFWGFGRISESIAGRMKSAGRLYVLLPKRVARRIARPMEFGVR
jgi:membrane-bound lytic murein transglycosylase A